MRPSSSDLVNALSFELPAQAHARRGRLQPLAHAVAVMLAAGGAAMAPAHVQAQQAFSGAWFAGKSSVQDTAIATGRLPNGQPVSLLTNPMLQQLRDTAQLQRSVNNLNLAARTIAAQQAAQEAARLAALNGDSAIPDGLAEGGLKVDTNSLTAGWINAGKPTQAAAGGRTQVTIDQTDEKAILNWESFNVGKNTTVNFNQRGGNKADGSNNWIALNRVNDPRGIPSQIAGQIKADGAVYIVNRNGIIFNGSSQVNTRSLVASSLALSDTQFKLGINNAQVIKDATGQANDFAIPQFGDFAAVAPSIYGGFVSGNGTAPDQLGGVDRFVPGATPGAVQVQAGAQLAVTSGGKLMLFAPKVRNAGFLSAPDGQVILAAGENIYLNTAPNTTNYGAAIPGAIRGLDVAASAVPGWALPWNLVRAALVTGTDPYNPGFAEGLAQVVLPEMAARAAAVGYDVTNSGIVQAERGNVTMQALNVHQNGVALATTALNNRSGSILLRAWGAGTHIYVNEDTSNVLLSWLAGTLTLGNDSVTRILPDAGDTSLIETTSLATRYQPGSIKLYGKLIDVQSRAGVLVPSGSIDMAAFANPLPIQYGSFGSDSLRDGSQIYIDSDAYLSVAGLQGAAVPMSRNFIEAELRINELRDSPLLLDSWLRGKKVIVDRRANGIFTDGPMSAVQWVKDAAGNYVPGAWAGTPLGDVTGWVGVGMTDLNELSTDAGKIMMRSSGAVITRAGSLLDVSGGSVRYLDGMNTATKLWGADGRVYTMDKALSDGAYTGIAGRYTQGHARWGVSETWASSVIGRDMLEAGYTEGRKAGAVQIFAGSAIVLEGDYAGGVVVGDRQQKKPLQNLGGELQLGGGSVEDRPWSPNRVIISHNPHPLGAGFGAGSALGSDYDAQPDPASSNQALGKITYLSDDVLSRSGLGRVIFNISGDYGFTVEDGAVVDLSPGALLRVGGGDRSANPIRIDGTIRAPGGSITLDAIDGSLTMGANGRLDVSGQWINAWRDGMAPQRWAIDGGSISAGVAKFLVDPSAVLDVSGGGRVDTDKKGRPSLRAGNGGLLTLSGLTAETDLSAFDIRGHAPGSASRLVLNAGVAVQLGGIATVPNVLVLPATLYGERGFGDVTVATGGNITVPQGVNVSPSIASIDLSNFAYRDVASGADLALLAPVGQLDLRYRVARAPAAIRLTSYSNSVTLGAGSMVRTDAGGTLALSAVAGAVTLGGTVEAPAGRIDLFGKSVTLAPEAQVLARGVPVLYTDSLGHKAGQVLAGGQVTLSNNSEPTVLALPAGALIDVSGATGEIDELTYPRFGGAKAQAVARDSDGGSIALSGGGVVAARMAGRAGGPGASGGSLNLMIGGTLTSDPLTTLPTVSTRTSLYYRNRAGVITAVNISSGDLDVFDEYGTAPVKITSAMRAAIVALKKTMGTGVELANDVTGPVVPGIRKPWEANTAISRQVVELLNRYFYTDAAATVKIVIPDVQLVPSARIAAGSLGAGGFGTVTLPAINVANGVNVHVDGTLIFGGLLGNGLNGGSARFSAARIQLNAGQTTEAAWSDPAALGGELTLAADLLDVQREPGGLGVRARISGYGTTTLQAGEIRLGGGPIEQITSKEQLQLGLDVDGRLILRAGQVYPGTANTAIIRAGQSITVERLGEPGAMPLSAGGTLRLEAPVIAQNGVLRAPFGSIALTATDRLSLGRGSITSVSGAGVVVPYGTLTNNELWQDPTLGVNPQAASDSALNAPPEKRVTLTAPAVDLARGAVVDIAGGGDLYAWEFVPGPGGSHDVLTTPGMFAVLPGYASAAPTSSLPSGARVWLAGGTGLAAGWYTLLPARYAMLPGAFAVQSTGKAWPGPAGGGAAMADGTQVMQGKGGNVYGNSQDAVASVWRVMSGSTLRRYTEYNEAFANHFFSSEAFKLTQYRLTGSDVVTPRLPRDGGSVVFDATSRLTLDGTLRSAPDTGGRGGLVDIAGTKIAIVGAGQDAGSLAANGYLVIDATSLSNFGAGSLLVGGKRTGDPLGLRVNVTASDIVLRNGSGSELRGPEIILAASGQVDIEAGSVLRATGSATSGAGDLVITPQAAAVYDDKGTPSTGDDVLVTPAKDWGALVRVANGDAVKVIRQGTDPATGGLVRIGAGAVIDGGAALLIDATRSTELAASARIAGIDLSVASGRVGFGGGIDGLVLDDAALAQLAQSMRLTLRSYSSFDFYRSMDLGAAGLNALTLDGAAFAGKGAGDITLRGTSVTLANTLGTAVGQGTGSGGFTLDADTLVLGAGQKTFSGFGAVTLAGRSQIVGVSKGGIDAGASALTLRTPLLTGRGGAAQSITTTGALQVLGGEGAAPASAADLQDSLGSRLSLSGASVLFGTRAVALGGTVDLSATNGSLTLVDGAGIDVGGFAKQFFDVAEYADAGRINLSAIGGDVRLASGSSLNVAGDKAGGSAGMLSLAASGGGTVVLDGRITAQAGAGGHAGSFALDIAALPDFAGFSQRLNEAGFNRSREFRIRQGNVVIDGATTVENFGLTADQGSVNITGSVDARSLYGGVIRVAGGNGVALQQGAQLLAGATGELGSGRVTLEASGGQLDILGGQIDVSGGDAGVVRLRALRTADQRDLAVSAMRASITGARSAVLEGVSIYNSGSVDAVKAQAIADAAILTANSAAVKARLGTSLAVMPGIEIRSAGDLTLGSDWNLFSDFAGAREGTLTLRAGGNLIVGGHLSDGFDAAGRTGVLQQGPSWNLRLVAGGDLASANVLALTPLAAQGAGQGNIVVGTANTSTDPAVDNGAGYLLRTGTGDIDVRAGRDLTLAHKESVIYTAGRKDMTAWGDFTTARADATYGVQGGNLNIDAQGSITAQPSGQRFTEWLNRQGNLNGDLVFGDRLLTQAYVNGQLVNIMAPAEQPSWWVNYGQFQQGVGAFGGGNVRVNAGGDLGNLVVALTTNMRMRGGRTAGEALAMETRNGGAMTVDAGGAIRGGQYYVARGTGEIRAGETTTGFDVTISKDSRRTQVFSIAPVLALGDATLSLRTAGDLRLQTVVDPLLVRYGDGPDTRIPGGFPPSLDYGAYMSGYTDRSALNLASAGGNITLVNQGTYVFRDLALSSASTTFDGQMGLGGNRYPALIHAAAMNGSLEIQGPMYVMPGTTNDVRLLAQQNVRFNNQNFNALMEVGGYEFNSTYLNEPYAEVIMARATPITMPSAFSPLGGLYRVEMAALLRNEIGMYTGSTRADFYDKAGNPDVLALANDYEPSRIYAAKGSILGADITASEQTWLRAGTDIRGIRMSARNVHAGDTTLLEAGNDILAVVNVRRPYGYALGSGTISVQGAGALVVSAGRDVYADDLTLETVGNQRYDGANRPVPLTQIKGLPEQGAAITVMSGMNRPAAYDAFAAAYLDPANVAAMPEYLKARAADGSLLPIYLSDLTVSRGGQQKTVRRGLVSYMKDITGETLAPLDAWARFQALPALAQQQFIRQVYFLELRDAGRNQNESGADGTPLNAGVNRGYAAIAALFPGDTWKGNVAANKLKMRTLSGGDINVLTPGGSLQVAALGATVPDGYGLVTLNSGHIGVFVKNDVTVNRSRILSFVPQATGRGSDQIIWASEGDIDAGKGSKTVRVPSAAEVITDMDGNTMIREKADMSGSGIGTVGDGDVDLIAPRGIINAGDAGIRVAGNLNIFALQVLNADNIQVKGESKGIPVIAAVNIGALTNASAAASEAAMAAQDVMQRERAAARQALPSTFTVRVIGFGNEPMEGGAAAPRRDGSQPVSYQQQPVRYDPASAFQVLGQGPLDASQRARLTEAERRRLPQ